MYNWSPCSSQVYFLKLKYEYFFLKDLLVILTIFAHIFVVAEGVGRIHIFFALRQPHVLENRNHVLTIEKLT